MVSRACVPSFSASSIAITRSVDGPGSASSSKPIYPATAARAPGSTSRQGAGDGTLEGSATIDLKHDVVATENDIRGSISRQTRAYVDRIINACTRYGDTLMVERQHGR